MKVNLVCYEDPNAWILGKFARKMHEELLTCGVDVKLSRAPMAGVDVNHHIYYAGFAVESAVATRHTLMVTHIDTPFKLQLLKKQLEVAHAAVCMSRETMQKLVAGGLPTERVTYINPAHDCVMRPRPLVLGITSKTHHDGRKRENLLLDALRGLSPADFSVKIMGSGWTDIVADLRRLGYTVEYFEDFDYDKYLALMPSLDYFMYFSFDEGSMGFIDALAAGVKTIVTPQGYHLDAVHGITHKIDGTPEDLASVLKAIAAERNVLKGSVSDWTWSNYAREHLALWETMVASSAVAPGPLSRAWPSTRKGVPGAGELLSAQQARNYRRSLWLSRTTLWTVLRWPRATAGRLVRRFLR